MTTLRLGNSFGPFRWREAGASPPDQVENRSRYEFFDGLVADLPQWTTDERVANLIVPPSVGEMSVMYNEAVRAWTMLYFDESNDAFQIRQSPQPWGPWSNPIRVATAAQAPGGLYGPYMNPRYVEDGGKTIYFTMSLWNPYDVYLAKATLTLSPPTIAFTHFNEPPLDAATYSPGSTGQELGFRTTSTATTATSRARGRHRVGKQPHDTDLITPLGGRHDDVRSG